ncbi:MAG: flagellar basal body L-ring protein FlgH [Spirochaetota bacterium]
MKRLCILLFVISTTVFAETIWSELNLYTPAATVTQNNTVVIIVDDISQLRYTLDVENETSSSVNTSPDTTITAFLPSVSSSKDISHGDSVNVESRGTLSMKIGASLGARQADGTFPIAGTKSYVFNGVANTIAVSGRINPENMDGAAIQSSSVLDFQLTINTTTQGLNLNLDRQLEEEESASTELTEEEKQLIITDYLERMIEELSK